MPKTDAQTGASPGATSAAPGVRGRSVSAGELASILGAELEGEAAVAISRVDPIEDAVAGSLTFIRDARRAAAWASCSASAALVTASIPVEPAPGHAVLRVPDADLALIRVLELFAPEPEPVKPGIDSSARVHPSARIDPSACVGPLCVVGARATIGANAVLVDRVSIGADVTIAPGVRCAPGVIVLERCRIGAGTILHGNVVVGTDGFGYRPSADGRGLVKIPHLGAVEIGAQVEIGAGTCIDRGKLGDTRIGDGSKIDNLVQIGHNCRIGRCCIICGHVAIGGSVVMGDGVQVGGGARIADNITLGPGAKLAGGSALMNDIPPGQVWLGYPAHPMPDAAANMSAVRSLAETKRLVRRVARKLGL